MLLILPVVLVLTETAFCDEQLFTESKPYPPQELPSRKLVETKNEEPFEFSKYESTPWGYEFSYRIQGGTYKREMGKLRDGRILDVEGEYSYVGADGLSVTVVYVANELGYFPTYL